MNRIRTYKTLFGILFVTFAFCVLSISAYANETEMSTSENDYETASVSIVNYTIFSENGNTRLKTISKDDVIRLRLQIADNRSNTIGKEPSATVNSLSFIPTNTASKSDATYHIGEKTYELEFVCRYTGVGKVFSFDLSYPDTDIAMQHLSIELSQCIEYVQPETTAEHIEEPTVKGTGFALKSLNYGTSMIYAGEDFTIHAVLMATRGDYSLENVSVSLIVPKELNPTNGSNVSYIGNVAPGKEIECSFVLSCDAIAEPGSYTVSLKAAGVRSADGTEVTSTVDFSVPIKQVDRFEISKIELPEKLNSSYDDGSGYATVYFINKGKTTIYNISVAVNSENVIASGGEVFVGNLDSGKEGNANFNLAAKKDGTLTGSIVVTYENADGETKTESKDFSVEAGAIEIGAASMGDKLEVEITKENKIPSWIWLLIGITTASLAFGIRYFISKRKNEEMALFDEGIKDDIP